MLKKVKVFAPATVANVSCGFDILGFPIHDIGDTIELSATDNVEVTISEINGPGKLSKNPDKNVCGVIAKAMLAKANVKIGIGIKLTKGIMPGSGMGSSAASSAATAFAVNELLGQPFSENELVEFSMLGEELASGTGHADNVAPSLLGGVILIRSYEPLDIVRIPVPNELYCTIIHPKIELRTELSRNILKKQVQLNTAVKQWGNVAGLIAGLYSSNYALIGRSLTDYIIEPVRSLLIPGFNQIKASAIEGGALGVGISGSGPSIFALSQGEQNAQNVAKKIEATAKELTIPSDIHVSKIAETGCRVIEKQE